MTTSATPAPEVSDAGDKRAYFWKPLYCAILSAAIPGIGQFLKRQSRRAAFLLATWAALISMEWLLRLLFTFHGLLTASILSLSIPLVASYDAMFSRSPNIKRPSWWFLLLLLPLALLVCQFTVGLTWRLQGVRSYKVTSTSMEPTLLEGEHIVADARYYSHVSPQRGDVIVFRHNGVTVLKRVVAVGGDIIEGTPSGLILNGYLLPESGVSSDADASFTFNELTVPPDQLFVVGDNQDVSYDSRVKNYGPVYMTDVVGKVLYIFLSPVRGRQGHEPR